jgi:hypothetical protein
VTTNAGVSGTVATATTTPAITLTLGAITPTTVNGLTLAALSTGFTVAGGTTSKTLTVNNTLAFSGTDSTVFTFPGASDTVETLAAAQTITGIKTFTPTARNSGAASFFTINPPADTSITASTEEIGFQTNTSTLTWATTGTVGLERLYFFRGLTLASASASQTFTDAFTVYISPPIQGTNAIITRDHSLGIVDSTSAASSITGAVVISTTFGTTATSVGIGGGNINAGGTITGNTLVSGVATGTAPLTVTSTTMVSNLDAQYLGAVNQTWATPPAIGNTTPAAGTFTLLTANGTNAGTALTIAQTARTSGVLPYVSITMPTDTGLTAATEAPGFSTVTGTRTWATTGTVALQREFKFVAPTYASASASQTFTLAATVDITGAPIQGTNAIITAGYALNIEAGGMNIVSGAVNLGSGTVTTTGNVGIGVAALATDALVVNPTFSGTGTFLSIVSNPNITFGVNSQAVGTLVVNAATYTTGAFTGLTAFGIKVNTPTASGTGTFANTYQLYLSQGLNTGGGVTVTNAYGLYQAGTDPNVLGGSLSVTGTSTLTGNVTVGSASGGKISNNVSAGTNNVYYQLTNTGGTSTIGIDSSAGATLGAGVGAYGLAIEGASGIYFGTGGSGLLALTLDTSQNAQFAKKISSYNGITTAGIGSTTVYSAPRTVAATNATTSLTAYTTPAADSSYHISANVLVTATTAAAMTVTCTYTDEGNTSRTLTLGFTQLTGATIISSITNVTGTGPYEGLTYHIRCKAGSTITFATAGTVTGITYNVEALVEQDS